MNEHFPTTIGQHAVSSEMASQSIPYDPNAQLHHSSPLTLEGHAAAYKDQVRSEIMAPVEVIPPVMTPETGKEYFNYSWQVPGVSEEVQDYVYERYTELIKAEQQPALPEDIIKLPRALDPESFEATLMRTAGFDEQKIGSREFTRADLQTAGFFFINRLGGGEKGIIHTTIPDPESPDGVLDLSNRTLLTKAELDKVYAHQLRTEGGLQGIPLDQVRADALTFLLAAQRPALFNGAVEMAEQCLPMQADDEAWQVGTLEERQAVVEYLEDFRQKYQEMLNLSPEDALKYVRMDRMISNEISRGTRLSWEKLFLAGSWTAGGAPSTTRTGAKAYSIYERSEKLRDSPSPFLESGFRFQENPDILVETPGEESPAKRMNMVNIHLMGGHPDYPGLSEMGQADWDQGYLSTGDFLNNFAAIITDLGEEEAWRQDLQMIDSETTRKQVIKEAQMNLIRHVKYKGDKHK